MSSIRESLQAAVAAQGGEEEAAPVETPVVETEAAPEPVEPVEAAPAEDVATEEKPRADRVRAPDGKFAKAPKSTQKPAAKASPAPAAPPPAVAPSPGASAAAPLEPAKPAAPKVKPPQSWRPDLREKFSALPEEVQAEIDRREREIAQGLQETAPARKFQQDFQQTVAAYAPILGNEPVKAIGGLLQSVHALQYGPPLQKAQLVAQIIKGNGVDIQTLAQLLDGQQPAQQPGAIDPESLLQQAEQRVMQRMQAQQQQQVQTKAQQEFAEFVASGKAEFLEDVKPQMGRLLQAGLAKNLEEAYNAAVKLNPQVYAVVQQREAAKQANAATASTQRARAASVSVKSQPAGVSAPQQATSIRGALIAAANKARGG